MCSLNFVRSSNLMIKWKICKLLFVGQKCLCWLFITVGFLGSGAKEIAFSTQSEFANCWYQIIILISLLNWLLLLLWWWFDVTEMREKAFLMYVLGSYQRRNSGICQNKYNLLRFICCPNDDWVFFFLILNSTFLIICKKTNRLK